VRAQPQHQLDVSTRDRMLDVDVSEAGNFSFLTIWPAKGHGVDNLACHETSPGPSGPSETKPRAFRRIANSTWSFPSQDPSVHHRRHINCILPCRPGTPGSAVTSISLVAREAWACFSGLLSCRVGPHSLSGHLAPLLSFNPPAAAAEDITHHSPRDARMVPSHSLQSLVNHSRTRAKDSRIKPHPRRT
jgi:hypothetical protein